jgi:hypothetical protein
VLVVAVVLLLSATWATAGVVALVVADICCAPNAIHPPIVPTIAAVAIADFNRAANCWRREVSLRVICVIP